MSESIKIPQFDTKGEKIADFEASFTLPEKVNADLLAQAVRVHLTNTREGNASVKTKGDVSGGGRKPWKQKGTGRARQGSTRSPHWRHGGIAHGPHPYDYELLLPKKMARLAFTMALLDHLQNQKVAVISGQYEKPATKEIAQVLAKLVSTGKLSLITSSGDENLKISARNLAGVTQAKVESLSAYDIIAAPYLVFSEEAAKKLCLKYEH